jgi:hypothetical protein
VGPIISPPPTVGQGGGSGITAPLMVPSVSFEGMPSLLLLMGVTGVIVIVRRR